MFVKTVKVKKPNPIAVILILVAVLVLIAVWVLDFGGKGIGDKYKLPTNEERTKFLCDLGWDISENETGCKVVKIPSKFNKVYEGYNKLQKEQGFNLKNHKGKTVEIYTYEVYNYPDKPNNIVAHLIICDEVLIGGDVCCTELEGFMQGLMPINKEKLDNTEENANGSENENNEANENANAQDAATTEPAETGATIDEPGFIFDQPNS